MLLKEIFYYLVFPGFLFSACVGLLAGGLERKVSARIQYRVGPPWYQNFLDILKLMLKEIIVPKGAKITFLLAPFIGLLVTVLVATLLGRNLFFSPAGSFNGDLIVIVYLLMLPALCIIIGASASANPLASLGAAREMKMILSYELSFILAILAVIIRSGAAIKLDAILSSQASFGANIFCLSGFLAFLVSLMCMQAKLGYVPFDISEAEQEIMGGVFIEYSGLCLALFKLTKSILLYVLPLLLIILFMGKDISPLFISLKYLLLIFLIILIKNTNPRLRIDQALRFFWRWPLFLGLAAVILALMGK